MTILKNLVVVTGTYTNRDGETKKSYKTIGQIHEGQNGQYITLDADVNLAAFPRKEGDSRVIVSLYNPKGKEEAQKPRRSRDEDFEDSSIPF